MNRKMFVCLSFLILVSTVLTACQKAVPTPEVVLQTVVGEGKTKEVVVTTIPEAKKAEPALLRINAGAYPDIIDPQRSSFIGEINHLKLIYEGLTDLDENLETIPGAAEKWEYNEDATEITFTLREGLTYSDGSVLNALRFEYAFMRNVTPATAGEYAQITENIRGAEAYRGHAEGLTEEEVTALRDAVEVTAQDMAGNACTDYEQVDCRVLKIGLDGNLRTPEPDPCPFFHTIAALWVGFPAKAENISEGGDIWWNSSKFQIGNGPFILQALEPFDRAHFTPNQNYWRGVATYDIEFRYIIDSSTSFEAYKNNEIDLIALVPEDLAVVQMDPALKAEAHIYPSPCTYALMFHQLKEPFTDQKVREAFAYALDREAWVKDVLKGLGSPTLTWIPPGFPGYDAQENRWDFDPEKAKQAIAESSYGSIENLPPITLTFGDTPRSRLHFEWLAAKYKEVLGIDMALDPVDPTTYIALTKDIETAPQVYILGWCADYPDPQNWLSAYWRTGAFGQRIGYSNPELDALLARADATVDPDTRMRLYADAQRLLTAGVPVAYFWNGVNAFLAKPWVKGIKSTPMDAGLPGGYNVLSITIDTSMIP